MWGGSSNHPNRATSRGNLLVCCLLALVERPLPGSSCSLNRQCWHEGKEYATAWSRDQVEPNRMLVRTTFGQTEGREKPSCQCDVKFLYSVLFLMPLSPSCTLHRACIVSTCFFNSLYSADAVYSNKKALKSRVQHKACSLSPPPLGLSENLEWSFS